MRGAARLSSRRRRRRRLRQHRPRPLPAAAAAAGLGLAPGSGLGARGSGLWRGLSSGSAIAGAAGEPCGAGTRVGTAARSAVAGTAAAARGLARPRRGDHAPFWLAPLRVPSALAAREAGFGAQPGAGGANHRRPSGRGRRVGEAGRPQPGTARRYRDPRDPLQPRAPSPGRSASGCVRRLSAAPAPCGGSRLARLCGRARQTHGAWWGCWAPASWLRRPRVGGPGPRRAPSLLSTPEKTGGKV
jgi:hypothetical protein